VGALFDDQNLYVSARCWDDHYERWVISGLQRDAQNITSSENFVVFLDTFYDRRNGFYFQTNPQGGFGDRAVSDDGSSTNSDWNPVWNVRSATFQGGWSLEMEIPFKSLRYRGSGPQVWGINFRRTVQWKNELSYLTRVPAQYSGRAILHASFAGTLVGLETPAQSMNLGLKPYVTATLTTDRTAEVPYSNKASRDAGLDLKYGLTRGLIADFTYRTDFAQVEEDTQQINLTRFSLFFPEKREFFLEGQGIFAFGGASASSAAGDVPRMFFSRRIGLSHGQAVPVIGGARLTGTAGRFDIGLLHMVTDKEPSADAVKTNFSVVRLKRGILRQSYVGILATRRSPTVSGIDNNLTVGADLGLVLSRTLTINSYYAWTRTPGQIGRDSSHRFRFDYSSDRYGFSAEQLRVGERFSPEVGFLRRSNFSRSSVDLRWEYTRGSELFLVYTEGRATNTLGFPDITNRTLAFKLTRLFRF